VRLQADRSATQPACDVDAGERPEDFTPERCAAIVRTAVGDPDLDVEVRSGPGAEHLIGG
jgi:hypothetical protein